MAGRFGSSSRSTEVPMDFEYTSRPSAGVKPVWATDNEDNGNSRKRSLGEMNPPNSPFPGTPHTPTFGRIQNVPFMLNIPPPQTPHPPAWVPPLDALPTKAFPIQELRDVDMTEVSPPKPTMLEKDDGSGSGESEREREISVGGLRRVFRSRQKARERNKLAVTRRAGVDDDETSDVGDEAERRVTTPVTQNTSNHYTLNLGGPSSGSDTPSVLIGYLQFFFNSALVLVFLYLLVQFILTVQRDVEHRVAEYSMDIVQDIAHCALQYKTNLCATRPIPAMLHQCGLWETCMNRDPTKVGRAKVVAELFAEVVNSFVEPISWKTFGFTVTSLAVLTVTVNVVLSLYRSQHKSTPVAPYQVPHVPLPPVGPYPQILNGSQGWSKSWNGEPSIEELPSRRRKLESGAAKDIH